MDVVTNKLAVLPPFAISSDTQVDEEAMENCPYVVCTYFVHVLTCLYGLHAALGGGGEREETETSQITETLLMGQLVAEVYVAAVAKASNISAAQ